MAPSSTTATCKKTALKLTKPVRSACRQVRASVKAISKPCYEYEQANTAASTTRAHQGPLVHRALKEAEETAMYSRTQGHRARPERLETSTGPATGSAGAGAAEKVAAVDDNSTLNGESSSWSSFAYLGDIHRMDDSLELIPPAGPVKNMQHWLCSPSARSIYSEASSSSSQSPPRRSWPGLLVEAASWENVQLACAEATQQARLMLEYQDPRYLTTGRFVGDADQWDKRRRATTWEQRQPWEREYRRYSSASSVSSYA